MSDVLDQTTQINLICTSPLVRFGEEADRGCGFIRRNYIWQNMTRAGVVAGVG